MSVQKLTENQLMMLMRNVASQIKIYTAPSLAILYGLDAPDKEDMAVGSGTFIRITNDKIYLLTAEHVYRLAQTREKFSKIAYSTGFGRPPAVLGAPIKSFADPCDIALFEIDASSLSDECKPLDFSSFMENTNSLSNDMLAIHGWPGEYSGFSPFPDRVGVNSESAPIVTTLGSSEKSWFDPSYHFAIAYDRRERQMTEHGKPIKLPDPHGLSGSSVWKINLPNPVDGWRPDMARVIGVAIEWDEAAESLIVTRVEHVRTLILASGRV